MLIDTRTLFVHDLVLEKDRRQVRGNVPDIPNNVERGPPYLIQGCMGLTVFRENIFQRDGF